MHADVSVTMHRLKINFAAAVQTNYRNWNANYYQLTDSYKACMGSVCGSGNGIKGDVKGAIELPNFEI